MTQIRTVRDLSETLEGRERGVFVVVFLGF